jgi:hypothetical protein
VIRVFWRVTLLAMAVGLLGVSGAQGATVSGTVKGQPFGGSLEALAGASVSVLDRSSGTTVAEGITDAGGVFSIAAPNGLFDVRVVPAAGQPFDATTVHEVDLSTPRSLEVVLIDNSTVNLTGTVRAADGSPVSNAKVIAQGSQGSAGTRSAADGTYSLAVLPGNYELRASGSNSFGGAPMNWALSVADLEVPAATTRDMTLPATSVLTLEALGAGDAPISGAFITAPGMQGANGLSELGLSTATTGFIDGQTDSQGRFRVAVFTGSEGREKGSLSPPPASGYGTTTFTVPRIDQDTTLVIRFQGGTEEEVDVEPPSLSVEAGLPPHAGWFATTPIPVHAKASDPNLSSLLCEVGNAQTSAGPGGESLELDLAVAGEGLHQVLCRASDSSGQVTERALAIPIDLTAPAAPVLQPDREPDFGGRWYRDKVLISALPGGEDPQLADGTPGSGVDPTSLPEGLVLSTSGRHEIEATVADVAGNVSMTTKLAVDVDATAPSSLLECPAQAELGSAATATWHDQDGESGLVGPMTGSQNLATGAAGWQATSHTATDNVGHAITSNCEYQVVYPYAVAGKTVAPPAFNARNGNKPKLSLEFSLGGNQGLSIFRAGFPTVAPIDCSNGSAVGSPVPAVEAAPLRYQANRGAYEYSLDTSSFQRGECVALELGLDDGTTRALWLRL